MTEGVGYGEAGAEARADSVRFVAAVWRLNLPALGGGYGVW